MHPLRRRMRLSGLDASLVRWIEAVTAAGGSVGGARASLLDDLVRRGKSHGWWWLLDAFQVYAAENTTAALMDMVRRVTATNVNSATFTADQGYAGDGATSLVQTNFDPSTDAVRYRRNDALIGCYNRTTRASNTAVVNVGCQKNSGSFEGAYIITRFSDGKAYESVNASDNVNVATPGTAGFWAANSVDATHQALYRNGISIAASSKTSFAIPALSVGFAVGANARAAATYNSFTTDQHAMFVAAGSMTDDVILAFYSDFQAYMTALGTQV